MALYIDDYPCDKQDDIKYSPSLAVPVRQRTILLPGGGCSYFRAMKGDACTFCAFPEFTREAIKGSGHNNFFGSWKLKAQTYKNMFDHLMTDSEDVDRIAIFNGGSFFPDAELPTEFQDYVYTKTHQHNNAKQLFVEAYPRFISQRSLERGVELLEEKELMVAIGFESHDDTVRNVMLKKGIDIKLFEKKIKLMQALGIKTSIYVFLKAPELTERQAHDEVISTLQYLSDLGIDEMVLSCAFVPEGTKLEKMFTAGQFRPPWLWSILSIMRHAEKLNWPLVVGGFDDTPPPIAGPSNCEKCNQLILGKIQDHRETGLMEDIHHSNCNCSVLWKTEMSNMSQIQRII